MYDELYSAFLDRGNTKMRLFIFTILAVASHAQNDATLEPEANGAGVVEAVVDKIQWSCIFDDDRLFMRRLAFVETADGLNHNTFPDDYHGGLWKVDENMFTETKHSSLATFHSGISSEFGISWTSVIWQDLRKPLYSGLAARLYIQHSSNGAEISTSIPDQAQFWIQHYRVDGDVDHFITEAGRLEDGCATPFGPDVVFVVDSSGSIGTANFQVSKDFVKAVAAGFEIGTEQNKARISVITFTDVAQRHFSLNSYSTIEEVEAAIDRIPYYAGLTETDKGVDAMVSEFNNIGRDQDAGHTHIGIILTDGQTAISPLETAIAKAEQNNILRIAVGVGGGVQESTLEVMGSDPLCMHVTHVSDFDQVESLMSLILKRSCEASAPVLDGESGSDLNVTLPGGGDGVNCKVKVPDQGATVKIAAKKGSATYFLARDSYPSEVYHEYKVEATPERMGVVYIPKEEVTDEDGIMYCNIIGDEVEDSDIEIGTDPGDTDECSPDPCKNGGVCYNKDSDNYECECTTYYDGKDCDKPKEFDCLTSNPCVGYDGTYALIVRHVCNSKMVMCGTGDSCHVVNCAPGSCWDNNDNNLHESCGSLSGCDVC